MSHDLSLVAFNMARQQLLSQKEDLRNLRNQASFGAAVTGLIATVFATLLGSEGFKTFQGFLDGNAARAEIWLLFILFGTSIFFSIRVILSWSQCTFEQSAKWTIDHAQSGVSDYEILSSLAIEAEEFFDQNEVVIEETMNYLWWSLVLSWTQIPFWILIISEARS